MVLTRYNLSASPLSPIHLLVYLDEERSLAFSRSFSLLLAPFHSVSLSSFIALSLVPSLSLNPGVRITTSFCFFSLSLPSTSVSLLTFAEVSTLLRLFPRLLVAVCHLIALPVGSLLALPGWKIL